MIRLLVYACITILTLSANVNIGNGKDVIFVVDANNTLLSRENNSSFQKVLDNIFKVDIVGNTYFAIDNRFKLYTWGYDQSSNGGAGSLIGKNMEQTYNVDAPVEIDTKEPIIDVATDNSTHTLIVGKSGSVYITGDALDGTLGFKGVDDYSAISTFTKIPTLHRIKSVSAGYWFSLALDRDGNVYSWGRNFYGQLGLGDRDNRDTPIKIPTLKDIKEVVAGGWNSFALSNSGKVYGWGYNLDNILGEDLSQYVTQPTILKSFENIKAKHIFYGYKNIFVIDENGSAYGLGDNSNGQIGGNDTFYKSAHKIPLENIIDIAPKESSTLFLTKDGYLYALGKNVSKKLLPQESEDKIIKTPLKIATDINIRKILPEIKFEKITLKIKKGWNFIGIPANNITKPENIFNKYLIWNYKGGVWRVNSDIYDTSKYQNYGTIYPGEGFWLLKDKNSSINFDKFDFDINKTDAFKSSSNGWSMLSVSKDTNLTQAFSDGIVTFEHRKIFWVYRDGKWLYFTKDQNISNRVDNKFDRFNGIVKRGEAFWVYTDSPIYDYRVLQYPIYYDSPAISVDKNDSTAAIYDTKGGGKLIVFKIKNHKISSKKEKLINLRNYMVDQYGRAIFTTDNSKLYIFDNDENLSKIGEFDADGYIWNIKQDGYTLYLDLGDKTEEVDVKNITNINKVSTLSASSFNFIKLKNSQTISVDSVSDKGISLYKYDKNYNLSKKLDIIKGNMLEASKIYSSDSKVYIGYHGYTNYPDENSYLSGILVYNYKTDSVDKNVSFGDKSLLPFAFENGKIYMTYQDAQGGGLRVLDDNLTTIYSYNFDGRVTSLKNAQIVYDKYILVYKTNDNGGYISLFDKELNFLADIKISEVMPQYEVIKTKDKSAIILFPKKDATPQTIFKIAFNDNKPAIKGKIELNGNYNYLRVGINNSFYIEGKLFQIVDFQRELNNW